MARIVERYLRERVIALPPADSLDAFLSPYYGWIIEWLVEGIKPDTSQLSRPMLRAKVSALEAGHPSSPPPTPAAMPNLRLEARVPVVRWVELLG